MNKNILLVIVLVITAIALFWFGSTRAPDNTENNTVSIVENTGVTHSMTLTENGYVPNELTINLGDTVVFNTETDRPFWPASNLHPSHRDYSEFDPRKPIPADEVWEFTFAKEGDWDMHDHLAPYFTAIIHVAK